jgi:phosphatidylserine decarboxylase
MDPYCDLFDRHAAALRDLTDSTASNHAADPKETLHQPANHESSHSFLRKHFPSAYLMQHLDNLESAYHMGNYVIDRETGIKIFEPMSIYVRLGMHLLYYGTEQSKLLHLEEAQKLLEEESIKMGQE